MRIEYRFVTLLKAWIIGKPVIAIQSEPPLTILAPATAVKPALSLDTSGLPLNRDAWSNYDSATSIQSLDGRVTFLNDSMTIMNENIHRPQMLPTPPPDPFSNALLENASEIFLAIDDASRSIDNGPETKEISEFRRSEPILSNAPPSLSRRSRSKRNGRIWGESDWRLTVV